MTQHNAQERFEALADPPSRKALLRCWLDGTLSLEQYAEQMDVYYPMSVEELRAALGKPLPPLWGAVIERMERARGQSEAE